MKILKIVINYRRINENLSNRRYRYFGSSSSKNRQSNKNNSEITKFNQINNLNYSPRNGNLRHLKCRPYPRIMGRGKKLHLIIYNLQK